MEHEYIPSCEEDQAADMMAEHQYEAESYRHHHEIIDAFCDLCSTQGRGTGASLRADGWGFAQGAEFCPSH